jgi:hypothetical protein
MAPVSPASPVSPPAEQLADRPAMPAADPAGLQAMAVAGGPVTATAATVRARFEDAAIPDRKTRAQDKPAATLRARVAVEISALLHERLRHEQERLAAARGRAVSFDEVLLHLLDGEDRSRARYIPVVWTTRAGEPLALRTGTGCVAIDRADLAGLTAACEPVDIGQDALRLAKQERARRGPRRRTRPAEVDRHVLARSGGTCEVAVCSRPGTATHHWTPWASGGTHDPGNLSRLCASHASLADRGLLTRPGAGAMRVQATAAGGRHAGVRRRFEEERRRAIARAADRRSSAVPRDGGSTH